MELTQDHSASVVFGLINGTFSFHGKEVHSVTIGEDVWFRGNDVGRIIGYVNATHAIAKYVHDEDTVLFKDLLRSSQIGMTFDYNQNELNTKYINEAGVYSLVFRSKLPVACEFERYVRREVLPKIRKQEAEKLREQVANLTRTHAQHAQETAELRAQIAALERQKLTLSTYVQNVGDLEKTQVFYLATTTAYAAQNRFKFGGVRDERELKGRLASYNTGRAVGDLYFYVRIYPVHAYKTIEERLHVILAHFKDKHESRKEMVQIRFPRLCEVVDYVIAHFGGEVDYMNVNAREILDETIHLPPETVDPVELTEETQSEHIDVTDWTESQFGALFEGVIEQCAVEQKVEYTFKEDGLLFMGEFQLPWGAVARHLREVRGLSMTQWREKYKAWHRRRQPARLKIRGLKLH